MIVVLVSGSYDCPRATIATQPDMIVVLVCGSYDCPCVTIATPMEQSYPDMIVVLVSGSHDLLLSHNHSNSDVCCLSKYDGGFGKGSDPLLITVM